MAIETTRRMVTTNIVADAFGELGVLFSSHFRLLFCHWVGDIWLRWELVSGFRGHLI